jgi:hypothetical protein
VKHCLRHCLRQRVKSGLRQRVKFLGRGSSPKKGHRLSRALRRDYCLRFCPCPFFGLDPLPLQDGSIPGYACLLVLHPESAIAIVLLSNEIDRDTALRLVTVANSITRAIDKGAVLLPLD